MDEPIEMNVVDGEPAEFRWNNRTYQIFEILHTWESERSAWWNWRSRGTRRYYRVQAGWNRHRLTVEFYVTTGGKEERWVLSHIYD